MLTWQELVDRVAEFEQTWWIDDPEARDRFAARPELEASAVELALSGQAVRTSDIHKDADTWSPIRTARHRQIVGELTGARTPDEVDPIAIVLIGLPGSGKSTVGGRVAAAWLAAHSRPPADATFDPDAVRIRLPEYQAGLGSNVVQIETADVAYSDLQERFLEDRRSIVWDTVGDPIWTKRTIDLLTDAGFQVHLMLVDVDVETAVDRVMKRALEVGRYVPPAYVRDVGHRPRTTFAELHSDGRLSGWVALNAEVPPRQPPVVIDGSPAWGARQAPIAFW